MIHGTVIRMVMFIPFPLRLARFFSLCFFENKKKWCERIPFISFILRKLGIDNKELCKDKQHVAKQNICMDRSCQGASPLADASAASEAAPLAAPYSLQLLLQHVWSLIPGSDAGQEQCCITKSCSVCTLLCLWGTVE